MLFWCVSVFCFCPWILPGLKLELYLLRLTDFLNLICDERTPRPWLVWLWCMLYRKTPSGRVRNIRNLMVIKDGPCFFTDMPFLQRVHVGAARLYSRWSLRIMFRVWGFKKKKNPTDPRVSRLALATSTKALSLMLETWSFFLFFYRSKLKAGLRRYLPVSPRVPESFGKRVAVDL